MNLHHDNSNPAAIPTPMQRALALGESVATLTSPNPRVGCVITDAQGRTLGEGATQRAGGPHAEVMALADARQRGHDVRGATVWVTLEPCSHHGRTGPCCDALIAAGVSRVVASLQDPNPRVAGQGFARLRAAGIEVIEGPGAHAARETNIGFFSRMMRGRPWVRMKIAASLDGRTALADGSSQWITSQPARDDGHAWRARACAVLSGIGTVLEDNPRLDVRAVATQRQPALVLVDSRLQVPADAALWQCERLRLVYAADAGPASEAAEAAIRARGATVVRMPDALGKVDLRAMLHDLAQREINEVHVEAGHKLNGSLWREGLVDELLVYLAPRLIGPGREMLALPALGALSESRNWSFFEVQPIGPDVRLRLRDTVHAGA